jgi:Bacterial Ig-like domain
MKDRSAIKLLSVLLTAVVVLFKTMVLTGCANIIPPTGGPRDSLPPRLEEALPHDSALNFKGNRITLNFDEYIDLQDVQNNLLFTPTFQNNPVIAARLRTLTIRFRDTLLPNTTYTLNFGNAIKDVNEGNVLRNFKYVFSTGPYLDSLTLQGRVLVAETGEVDTTIMVLLHKSMLDSAVVKDRPRYVARVDRNGYFKFTSLPRDTFAIYALGDAGFSKRYQSKNQLFAFANAPVISGSRDSIVLYAYREAPKVNAGPANMAGPGTGKVTTTDRRLRFNTNIVGNQMDLQDSLVLTFTTPLRSYDTTKMSLTRDSSFTPVRFTTTEDTSRTQLSLHTPWAEGISYHLILQKDFATDTSGRQLLKADTVAFTTKTKADYGSLTMRLHNIELSRHPVLQFVQNDRVVYSAPVTSGTVRIALIPPGDYDLRLLYDENGNGKWDKGQFFGKKRQPEIVQPITPKITVRAAWDNEFTR